MAQNRLGGNFAFRPFGLRKASGRICCKICEGKFIRQIDNDQVDRHAREALKPFENSHGENPYSVQRDLQEVMQDNVGIVRDESEMRSALDHLKTFWERAAQVGRYREP